MELMDLIYDSIQKKPMQIFEEVQFSEYINHQRRLPLHIIPSQNLLGKILACIGSFNFPMLVFDYYLILRRNLIIWISIYIFIDFK